jgi:hypothetical protein
MADSSVVLVLGWGSYHSGLEFGSCGCCLKASAPMVWQTRTSGIGSMALNREATPKIFAVMIVTLANGGDNLSVYCWQAS